MRTSVAELYDHHPFDANEREWFGARNIDEAVSAADKLHLVEEPFTYLEDLSATDPTMARDVRQALLGLPPDVMIAEYGMEVGLWTAVTNPIIGVADRLRDDLAANYGVNLEDLDAAQLWTWKSESKRAAGDIVAQYGLMQSMRSGEPLESIDLERTLQSGAKTQEPLKPSRIADYALRPVQAETFDEYFIGGRIKGWDEFRDQGLLYSCWLDAPTGFALTYKGKIQALAGIALAGDDELMQYQIQGAYATRIDPTVKRYEDGYRLGKVSARGLAPIDWQKVMVEISEQIAISRSLGMTGIQAGKNNAWSDLRTPKGAEPHLPLDKAEKAYDRLAERLGYWQADHDDRGDWHKQVV